MARKMTSEEASKLGKKSQSAEIKAKRALTIEHRKAERLLAQGEVLQAIKNGLFEIDEKSGLTWYERFLKSYMNEALEDTASKQAETLAKAFFSADVLSKLDEQTDKIISKDLAFYRYRLNEMMFDKQRKVIADRFIYLKCLICSRRAGKTIMNAFFFIDACLEKNTKCLYIHLTFENGIAQLFDKVIEIANSIDFKLDDGNTSKNDGLISFTNGSSIRFRGNANRSEAEKLRGFEFPIVIIDECQSQRGLQYLIEDIIQPLQVQFDKHYLILTGTPPRTKKTYFEKCFTGGEFFAYTWSMLDNPFIQNAKEKLAEICKRKGLDENSALIKREYLGQIIYDDEALVFKGYKTYTENDTDFIAFIPNKIYIGVDFGFSDYNAIVALACDTVKHKAYVINTKKFNHSTVTTIIDEVISTLEDSKQYLISHNTNIDLSTSIYVICDTNEKSISYELAVNYRLPVYNAYKYDKNYAISYLADLMRSGEIKIKENDFIADECEQTLYKRRLETDELTSDIDDSVYHPDALFALLYASRQYSFDCGYADKGTGEKLK